MYKRQLKWNAGYSEDVLPYTNNIYQKDGGTHLLGFRSALTRVVNKYANEQNLLKKNKVSFFHGKGSFTEKQDQTFHISVLGKEVSVKLFGQKLNTQPLQS